MYIYDVCISMMCVIAVDDDFFADAGMGVEEEGDGEGEEEGYDWSIVQATMQLLMSSQVLG